MGSPNFASAPGPFAEPAVPVPAAQQCDTVLTPVSHPELGEIRIEDDLFPIGRNEQPFASYEPEIVAELSRRHARIFSEYGAVYVADLGSKNGTTVNGADIREKICRLQEGDVLGLGKRLSYRVRLGTRIDQPRSGPKLASLTLTPEQADLELQQIVITQFPFLISKSSEYFDRYKASHPRQLNYLSRRHAHIFLRHGAPYLEDLGSTNGSYLNGQRLDEHAMPLKDGDEIAFGGHHFVYRISLQFQHPEGDLTMTRYGAPAGAAVDGPALHPAESPLEMEADKTTFVAAPGSFLNIFCVDPAPEQEERSVPELEAGVPEQGQEGRGGGKWKLFLAEIRSVLAEGEQPRRSQVLRWGAAAAVILVLGAALVYRNGASEREMKALLEDGQYARAAELADRVLADSPEDAQAKAIATEAALKAHVPSWLAALRAGNFDGAEASLQKMKQASTHNPELPAMLGELEWMGQLERFAAGRPASAPIRIFQDEDSINSLLQRWNDDTPGHQRTLSRIAAYVPEFKQAYADALSHLRRLQGEDAVYLAAIARLKAAIDAELKRDQPEALEPLLSDYAAKYPRIGGMENIKSDLRRYLALDRAVRSEAPADLVAALADAQFITPPFQAKHRALVETRRLPANEAVTQYQAVSRAWRAGDVQQALTLLRQMNSGPTAALAAGQLERKRSIAEEFAGLQQVRSSPAYAERLLAFYAVLDPDEDAYFIQAVAPDLAAHKDKVLQRAQESFRQAQGQWQRFIENGGMAAGQRLETQISPQFRTQAQLLSAADKGTSLGMRLYSQLKVEPPAEWRKLHEEVHGEFEQQRKSLQELRSVLDPALLKSKLALLTHPAK